MRIDKIMFKNENRQLNFIDLFAGAGGLSEGFFQAGFNPIAHVEMNKSASKTLETNGLNIPGIEHGYLLIGGYYAGEELIQSVFQISDEKGKICIADKQFI